MFESIGFIIVTYTAIIGWIASQNDIEIPANVRHELYNRLL